MRNPCRIVSVNCADLICLFIRLAHTHIRDGTTAALGLEVFDYNGDGRGDIYVVQQSQSDYCQQDKASRPWGSGATPPNTWVPSLDMTPDLVFRGRRPKVAGNAPYTKITMKHQIPGCGGFVEKLSDKSLILSQGDDIHAGQGAVLTWV